MARVEFWRWGMQSASARTPSARPASFRSSGATRELADLDADARGGGGRARRPGPAHGRARASARRAWPRRWASARATDGHRVAWARGWDGGGAPAFWPWVQVVRALAADRDDDALRAELGAGARWVAQLAPELRERLDLPEARRPRVRAGALRALRRRRGLPAQRRGRRAAASCCSTTSTPPTCRRCCCSPSSRARSSETRVLVDHHPSRGGPAPRARGRGVFGELTRFGARFDLGGLEDDDLRALVLHRSGADPSEELVHSLHAADRGQPASTPTRSCACSSPRAASTARCGERAAAARRRARRDPPAPAAAARPRSARRSRWPPSRAATSSSPRSSARRASPAPRLLERLDEAVAVQLLEEAPGPAGSFRFAHGLIRETLYGDLTATRRAPAARRGRRGARARRPRTRGRAGPPLRRGGAASATPAKALDHAQRAGHEALAALAYERAADLFDAALTRPRPAARARRAAGAASCCSRAARRRCRRAATRRARRCWPHRARPARSATPTCSRRAALSLGGFGLSPGIVDDELVAVLEEALERPAARRQRAARAAARAPRRRAVLLRARRSAARSSSQEALGIARGLDDPPTLAFVLDQGQIATNGPDTTERGLAWAQELFALADAAGDPELGGPRAVVADRPAARARRPAGRRHGDRDARPHRHRLARPARPRLHPAAPRAAGDDRRAPGRHRARSSTRASSWAGACRTRPCRSSPARSCSGCASGQGRLRELEDAVRQFADQLPAMPAWRVALATLYLHTGRARRGAARVRPPRRARLRDHPARQRLVDRHGAAGRAERDLPRRRARDPCSRSCWRPSTARNVVTPDGHLRRAR